ncbi:DUF4040 domain-containing protein [Actinomadura miaoliensis]|uniref:MrpA C-terminal/MbhD domain-containing protein n=1 Tax=Actinomadura miaoliensis TaxID=430685 RepID=A0ABP7V8Y2_9ACTN
MKDALIYLTSAMAVVMATVVVLTRAPVRQAMVLSGYGLTLGVLFVVLQAPDVALSQIGVGTVVIPLLVLLAVHAARRHLPPPDTPHPSGPPPGTAPHAPDTHRHRPAGRGDDT